MAKSFTEREKVGGGESERVSEHRGREEKREIMRKREMRHAIMLFLWKSCQCLWVIKLPKSE